MTTPKLLAVAAAAVILSGCTATVGTPAPSPTPTPPASFVPIDRSMTATPTPTAAQSTAPSGEWVPGPLRPGPTPGTVLGPSGKVLRLIPADPDRTFRCRALTATERRQLELDAGSSYERSKAARAVDLPEGYSIVGYWDKGLDGSRPAALLSGEHFTGLGIIPTRWYGSHTNAGIAFDDGPKAVRAALDCIS